ncbi:DNA-binding protein [uncultured Thiodictyon sp.]|uniref:DNA-binding protein n=1 Tax=uncultured Thiodictyon sp. TaxID=1846217 RepID=UPI0025F194FA|nr:DNA-binding protein [uncultured Thiodictyon sp.]
MARAGISKHLVQQARDALLVRGENPSIDAVRVELGNTGSKSTIHRYLQELAQAEGTRLDDEQLLSATLGTAVAALARQLREEARVVVEVAETRHAAEAGAQRAEMARLERALGEVQVQAGQLGEALADERDAHAATREALQQERIRTAAIANENAALTLRLAEHGRHLESLEEKHRHARDSLEHYRQSVKDQRDLDQRRHETQVQQIQAELRQLAQTLVAKQDEVTRSGQDCARLSAELAEARRELRETQQAVRGVQRAKDALVTVQARLAADNATLTEQLAVAEGTRQALVAEERALRQSLAQQDGVVQRLQVRLDVQASLYGDLQRRLDRLGVPSAPDDDAT